jgi:hypothetical protein
MRWQYSTFSAEPAVVMTVAPQALATWMAVVPMPLLPPWMSTVSPRARRARSRRLWCTVKSVSGRVAAAAASSPAGHGRQWSALAAQYSA